MSLVAPVVSPSLHQTPPSPYWGRHASSNKRLALCQPTTEQGMEWFLLTNAKNIYLCYNDKNRTETSPTYCTLRGKTRKTTYVSLDLCSCRNLRFTSQAQLRQLRIQLYQSLNDLAKILVESYLCHNALAKLHGHTFQVGQLNVK